MIQNEFTQSQGHGLFLDSEIRESVFKLEPCKNDTKKYDIDYNENIFNKEENVSIKTSKNDGFGGGDILRFYNIDTDKKCTIILIKYKQEGDNKKIREILEIDYTKELKDYLFGSVTEEILTESIKSKMLVSFKTTTHLVMKAVGSGSSKEKKAMELGVTIMTVEQLEKLLY
jgi:hypothetical protein